MSTLKINSVEYCDFGNEKQSIGKLLMKFKKNIQTFFKNFLSKRISIEINFVVRDKNNYSRRLFSNSSTVTEIVNFGDDEDLYAGMGMTD